MATDGSPEIKVVVVYRSTPELCAAAAFRINGLQVTMSKGISEARKKATAEIEDLNRGILPSEKEERTAPNRDDLLDSAASTHAAHVAGPTSINPAGRDGGARVSNVRSDAGGVQSTPERCGAAARYDSDDGTKGEEGEENEDVQASSFYTVPDTASARIKEVKGLCGNGRLAKAQSPLFLPDDPTKASSSASLPAFLAPTVYVHAWHLYYKSRGIPTQPPCPKHGWKAVEEKNVISRGWTEGRRVSGTSEDMYMIGTKHNCMVCKTENKRLKALVDAWMGDEEGKQRRLSAVKANPYTFCSYDPAVTRLYAERYPWIAATNRVVVCTRKTAMSEDRPVTVVPLAAGVSRGRQLHLQLDLGSMPPPATGSPYPSCCHTEQTEVGAAAGAPGAASTVTVKAVAAVEGGLPGGTGFCDGALHAGARRRVYQAPAGAAVGAAVSEAEGDLPGGSGVSDGAILADAGRRVYPVHQPVALDGTGIGETAPAEAAPDAREVARGDSEAVVAVTIAQLKGNQQQQHHESIVSAKRAAAAPTETESQKRIREEQVGEGRGAVVQAQNAGARENQSQLLHIQEKVVPIGKSAVPLTGAERSRKSRAKKKAAKQKEKAAAACNP